MLILCAAFFLLCYVDFDELEGVTVSDAALSLTIVGLVVFVAFLAIHFWLKVTAPPVAPEFEVLPEILVPRSSGEAGPIVAPPGADIELKYSPGLRARRYSASDID